MIGPSAPVPGVACNKLDPPAAVREYYRRLMHNHIQEKMDFIFGRRSIRSYTAAPVDDQTIQTLLEAAMAAPSAAGRDPWRFIVVKNRQTLTRMAEILPYGRMLASAPLGMVVCGDLEAAHDKQLSYMLQDCSAAIENLLLAVHIHGLGACWLGVHPREDRVKNIQALFQLPATMIPVSCIAIGHPGETKEPRTRFNPAFVRIEK